MSEHVAPKKSTMAGPRGPILANCPEMLEAGLGVLLDQCVFRAAGSIFGRIFVAVKMNSGHGETSRGSAGATLVANQSPREFALAGVFSSYFI